MIVQLTRDGPPTLTDLDRLDRLHVECDGALHEMQLGDLAELDDHGDEHVWLDVATARAAGAAAAGDSWTEQYDAMIAYASAKGWVNDAGTHVRAHVERSP